MAGPVDIRIAPHGDNPVLRIIGALSAVCGVIAAAMIAIAVLITCQMIFVRFVLNQSTVWQTEAVVYLMVAATMIGLPYVQRVRGHVNVDLLPRMLPFAARKGLAFLVLGIAIVTLGVMAFYGYELWHVAWARGWTSDTIWAVPLWIPYLALPLGFGLYLLQLSADLFGMMTDIEAPFSLDDHLHDHAHEHADERAD
ncbi:MAG: TRAP transporter small permease [Pseudomonadota bacterium]